MYNAIKFAAKAAWGQMTPAMKVIDLAIIVGLLAVAILKLW